jgi:hypothetical protein
MAIPSFLLFLVYFGIFFPFWYIVPRKIWQPCFTPRSAERGLRVDQVGAVLQEGEGEAEGAREEQPDEDVRPQV